MHIKIYKKYFGYILLKIQKKTEVVKKNFNKFGYLALLLFVAIPLPGTGAWTGCLIAWIMKLDRIKSFFAIAIGIIIAGVIILLISLGIFSSIY